jgi:D-arabinose 1-dehydrogenase-like Zn-dependent alcohol dehydrogenase
MIHHWETADGPQVLGHEGAGIVELTGKIVRCSGPAIMSFCRTNLAAHAASVKKGVRQNAADFMN